MNLPATRTLAAAVILLLLAFLVWHAATVFLVLFAGLLFAVFLCSIADFLERKVGLPHALAYPVTLLLMMICLVLFGWLLAARIAGQVDELARNLKSSWDQLSQATGRYQWLAGQLGPEAARPQIGFGRVAGIFNTTFGALGSLALAVFAGIYIAYDPGVYRRGVLHLVPVSRRPRARQVLTEIWETLRWWLIGQVVSMSVIGVGTTIGLLMLGIPMALVLGLIAFVLTFIPYIGPILSAVPAVLVALTVGNWTALYVVLLYASMQSVESYLVTPVVQQRSVHLPPGVTLAAQALMGFLFGVPGLIVATPLTAASLVAVRMAYVEDILNDNTSRPPS